MQSYLLAMISAADSENITSDGLPTDDNDSNDNNRGTVFSKTTILLECRACVIIEPCLEIDMFILWYFFMRN